MINIDFDGIADDNQRKGYYFKSNNDNYLIEVVVKDKGSNCLVTIFELGIPQKNGKVLTIENGQEIAAFDVEYLCEINLWNKYFFPKFKTESYQWYYDVKEVSPHNWQLNKQGNENKPLSIAEVMNFAIELGLKVGEIKLY
jgi:hypothetical protein